MTLKDTQKTSIRKTLLVGVKEIGPAECELFLDWQPGPVQHLVYNRPEDMVADLVEVRRVIGLWDMTLKHG